MAAYPEYRQTATLQPTAGLGSSGVGGGVASGLASLGAALGSIAGDQMRQDKSEEEARARFEGAQKGPDLVYRDDNGDLRVQPLPPPDSDANRATISSAQSMYLTRIGDAFRDQATVLRQQYASNPDGFRGAWMEFTKNEMAGAPQQWLARTKSIADDIGGQHVAGITIDVDRQQEAQDKSTWADSNKRLSTELIGLSEAGLAGDPRFAEKQQQYDESLRLGVDRGWLSPTTEGFMREQQVVDGKAAMIAGSVLAEAKGIAGKSTTEEGFRAGLQRVDELVKSPELATLTPQERERITTRFTVDYRRWAATMKADTSALDKESDGIRRIILSGQQHDPARVAEIVSQYRAAGEPEKAAEMQQWQDRASDVRSFALLPPAEQAQQIAAAGREVQTPDSFIRNQMRQQAFQAKVRALNDDALSYGTQAHESATGPLRALPWSQVGGAGQAAFSDALKERKRQAQIISSVESDFPVSPLTKQDTETLDRLVTAGNADQKAALAAALYDGLGDVGIAAVTPQLFKKGEEQRAFSVAAEIAGAGRADVARAIFIGRDILAGRGGEKASVMPKPQELVAQLQAKLYPVYDPFSTNDPEEARQRGDMLAVLDRYQALSDAATSYYAYLARGVASPDVTDTVDRSLAAVTGGILSGPGGTRILAPRPGMTQSEFDDIWASIGREDLGQIAPTDQGPITVEDVRRYGMIRSIGDGEYAVYLQASGGPRRLYRDAGARTPVVISLKDKTATPQSWVPSGIGLFN